MGKAVGAAALLAVFALILLSGCVTEKTLSGQDTEKVLSAASDDIDGDGYADVSHYVFRPIVIDAANNIVMQKFVDAGMVSSSLRVSSVNNLSEDNVSAFEVAVFQYDIDRRDKENICKNALGLDRSAPCVNPDECLALCTSATCRKYAYASDVLGYWIYKYSQDEASLDSQVSDVKNSMVSLDGAGSQERQLMMERLSRIIDKTVEINSNPIFDSNLFQLCSPVRYDDESIAELLSMLGQYERTPDGYTYAVSVKFLISSGDYTDLEISDSIPAPILATLRNITVIQESSSYDLAANQITWPPLQLGISSDYLAGYRMEARQGMREDIFNNWPVMKVKTRVFSLSKSPAVAYVINTSGAVYDAGKGFGYYPALAVVLAFWDVSFFALLLILRSFIGVMSATVSRTGLRDALGKVYGEANYYWKEYLVASVVFLLLGVAFTYFAKPVVEGTLAVDNIVNNLTADLAGAGAALFLFLAMHTAYALLEDRFKGIAAGSKYYEGMMDSSAKANSIRLAKLREKAGEVNARIARGGAEATEAKSVVTAIPFARIGELMKKPGNERAVKELLEMYLNRLDALEVRVEEQAKVSSDYWPEWCKEIADKLAASDSVRFDSLTGIPAEWRKWAAGKFASENEDVVIDGETIRLAAGTPEKKMDDLLRKLTSCGLAFGGVLLTKDGVGTSLSKAGNQTLEAILAYRTAGYAKTLSQKVLGSDYRGMMIAGKNKVVVFKRGATAEGVLFSSRDQAKEAFAEFEKRIKTI